MQHNLPLILQSVHTILPQDISSVCFCFFGLEPSSSKDFNLFFIAAIFALRLVCPMLPPVRCNFCPSPTDFEELSAVSNRLFSLASRTTSGRPQANLPCIFSLANSASCILTLIMEIRDCLRSILTYILSQITSFELYCIKAKPRGSPRFGPRVCHKKSSDTIFPKGENIFIRVALKNMEGKVRDKNAHENRNKLSLAGVL